MPNDFKSSSPTPTAGQQRRQASVLLLQLQWLLIALLIIGFIWLYVSQQRFQNQMLERLQSNEQVVNRLNDMDDRIFALNQQVTPDKKHASTLAEDSQSQNQLNLLRLQLEAADSLMADNKDQAALGLLRGLQWQLSQSNNEIAPALKQVIQQGLSKDIARLQSQSAQPSPWQLQNIAIQNIQLFLTSQGRLKNHTVITRQQLTIHEVIMTLNLAMQAGNMREPKQLAGYLRQARKQLQPLVTASTVAPSQSKNTAPASTEHAGTITMAAPTTIAEVITGLDKLIASPPKVTPLVTMQIIEQSKS